MCHPFPGRPQCLLPWTPLTKRLRLTRHGALWGSQGRSRRGRLDERFHSIQGPGVPRLREEELGVWTPRPEGGGVGGWTPASEEEGPGSGLWLWGGCGVWTLALGRRQSPWVGTVWPQPVLGHNAWCRSPHSESRGEAGGGALTP